MKTRKEWKSDFNSSSYNNLYYTKDETVNEVIQNFNIRRYQSAEGFDVLIDSIQERVLIQDYTNPLNEEREDRKIHCALNSNIKRGSLVNWDSREWLVLTKVDSNQAYKSAKITECNYLLKWINDLGQIVESCSIVQDKTMYSTGINEEKYLITGDTDLVIVLPINENTIKIKRDDRFLICVNDEQPHSVKVTKVNDYNKYGLIILSLSEKGAELSENDNISLRIADYYNKIAIYSINILNGDIIDVLNGDSLQLNVEIKNRDKILANNFPELIYESSDESIAIVDNSGLISCINLGSVTITVKLKDDNAIYDTINLNITSSIVDNYTVEIFGENNIPLSFNKNYISKVYNNGIEIAQNCKFEIIPNNSIHAYIIDDSTNNKVPFVIGNSCIVKANNNVYSSNQEVILRCSLENDNSVYKDLLIKIKSLI